jgi:hypothetical protein
MAARKKATTPIVQQSDQQAAHDAAFPYAVESPYLAGWEHGLTEKCGVRGKTWTSTKSEPQWTVRFKVGETAEWFKKTWTAELS